MAGILKETALQWIENKVPALDKLCVIDCIGNIGFEKRLKAM